MRPINVERYGQCEGCSELIIDNGAMYCKLDKCKYGDDDEGT